jgi:hypothetical protein
MATQADMRVNQEVPITYSIEAEDGSPAEIEGALVAEVISGDVQAIVEGEGKTVSIVPGTTVGPYEVSVKGDADLGEGVNHIEDIITGTILGLDAARMTGTVGTPIPKRTV